MLPEIIIAIVLAAFVLQFFDAAVGMGYGEITAVLLLLGFQPLEVVPSVILTSGILSLTTGLIHQGFRNVNFSINSEDFKITSLLTGFGIIGVLLGAFIALRLPADILKTYIGFLVLVIGISILLFREKKWSLIWWRKQKISFKKIIALGSLAAFNKGISGGGFGPVLAGGQILAGVEIKKVVGITTMAEGIISLLGAIAYNFLNGGDHFNLSLILFLLVGGLLATPFGVYIVRKFHPRKLRWSVGIISIIMGSAILTQMLF